MAVRKASIVIAVLMLFMNGCATIRSPAGGSAPDTAPVGPERAQRTTRSLNLAGFPPEYQRGFREGCAVVGSGKPTPPSGDAQLVQGWRDGFSYCTRRPPQ